MATKSTKSTLKKSVKKTVKKTARKVVPKDLKKEVMEWIQANPGRDVARAAAEKFGVNYAHLKDWLKKEGEQVKGAVETLIKSRKKAAVKKAGENLENLTRAIKRKEAELKDLAAKLKRISA